MKDKTIPELKKYTEENDHLDELQVYTDALEHFSRGETYRNTPDPLRTSLQQDYAQFIVECFKREKRNFRSYALRF